LWGNPEAAKASHPKTSILKGGRVLFNSKGNDCRLAVDRNGHTKLRKQQV